ncbi:MAG: HigA family addiction module antidote protein [Rhizobiales bacterium]|nr:HigA family addiction module antitoxin [Hyphomicrobiales bacterium]NRB13725.1 HigA family addiction module antidote protein [Hyphomicrobiales bacterium]
MSMAKPSRPGEMIKNMLDELEITVTAAAKALKVARQTLNNLLNNEGASISPEMALRLEVVLGSTAGNWLRMQANYDEFSIRKNAGKIQKGLKKIDSEAA